jgi:hypothetical protein
MSSPTATAPSAPRLLAVGLAAGACGAGLLAIPLSSPPPQFVRLEPWWDSIGTAAATVALLRVLALVAAAWTVIAAVLGLLVRSTNHLTLVRIWRLIAPRAISRFVAASVIVGVSTPGAALAADPAAPLPVLHDLGPAPPPDPAPLPVLADLGAGEGTPAPDEPTASEPAPPTTVWIVERGDHLWSVAAETMAERGASSSDAATHDYWQRLIELNRDTIGPDPDLIHPGTVLTLP